MDAQWSLPVSQSLHEGLTSIAQSGAFQLNNVDCRSTSCVATLDWASRDEAKNSLGKLLDAKLGREEDRCARDVFFDDTPLNAAGKYQATVVFNCTRSDLARAE